MNTLLQIALTNAAAAAVLAVVVWMVTRYVRRPALAHLMWILVLVKLVTPPLIDVPVPVAILPPVASTPLSNAAKHIRATAHAEKAAAVADVQNHLPVQQSGAIGPPSVAKNADSESGNVPEIETVDSSSHASRGDDSTLAATATPDDGGFLNVANFGQVAIFVWFSGVVLCFFRALYRDRRFAHFVDRSAEFSSGLQARVDRLAGDIGLRRPPEARFTSDAISPMLWGVGWRLRLLFPRDLWESLDDSARDALLLHELAHYRRGDHLVRLLEISASVLYWWHPAVWLARREIESAEEQCCDAWVVARRSESPRTYAEALLATLDFVSEPAAALPPAASGIGELPMLKERLTAVMRGSVDATISPRWRGALIIAAATGLPLHPVVTLLPTSTAEASLTDPEPLGFSVNSVSSSANNSAIATDADVKPNRDDRLSNPSSNLPETPTGWWTEQPQSRWATLEAPDGRAGLIAEAGRKVVLERPLEGRRYDLSPARLTAAAFTSGGSRFVAGSEDGSVRIFDSESGSPVSLLGEHSAAVTGLAVSPDGVTVATCGRDGVVILWNADSGAVVSVWSDADLPVTAVCFSPDGASLAAAAGDWRNPETGRITMLNVHDRLEPLAVLPMDSQAAAIEFSPDARTLLAVDWNGRVTLLPADEDGAFNGENEFYGTVEKSDVQAAVFSPAIRFSEHVQQ